MTSTLSPPISRAHALRSFDVADFPVLHGREEEWRFTPLKRLRGLATLDGAAGEAGPPLVVQPSVPAGSTVSTVERDDRRFGSALTPFDRISALAYGRASGALLVQVDKGAVIDDPVSVTLVGGGVEAPSFGHTIVDIGELAQATVVVEYTGSATVADNVEVLVGAGAELRLVTVANWAADAVQAQHIRFRDGRDARVNHVQVALGGSLVRQFTSVEYAGRGEDSNNTVSVIQENSPA